ncbi:hypothetical protein [Treponema sp.]|uniref:hypothetical protein n=1 Tax=Treponema sp. TaxID=166 RepID=UPI002A829750|nr:hypothetical protein [Treponema sp.]MDY4133284.1 hypothetical protein [Treponema sp.]
MPTNLMMAYETLEIEDQKLVEQLIYSLVMKVKNQSQVEHDSEKQRTLLSELEALKGTLSGCKYRSIEAARDDRLSEKYGV